MTTWKLSTTEWAFGWLLLNCWQLTDLWDPLGILSCLSLFHLSFLTYTFKHRSLKMFLLLQVHFTYRARTHLLLLQNHSRKRSSFCRNLLYHLCVSERPEKEIATANMIMSTIWSEDIDTQLAFVQTSQDSSARRMQKATRCSFSVSNSTNLTAKFHWSRRHLH